MGFKKSAMLFFSFMTLGFASTALSVGANGFPTNEVKVAKDACYSAYYPDYRMETAACLNAVYVYAANRWGYNASSDHALTACKDVKHGASIIGAHLFGCQQAYYAD